MAWEVRPVIFLVVGAALFAFGIYQLRDQRVPRGAALLRGTVVDVQQTRSAVHRKRTVYRPVVSVDHPRTGRREVFSHSAYGLRTHDRGDPIDLWYDACRDRFVLVSARPVRDFLLVPAIGLAMMGMQIADWVS